MPLEVEVIDDSPAATSAAAATVPAPSTQADPEATAASPGVPAETTPPSEVDELAEFKADVAKATGAEPATETEAEATPAPETTDDPDAATAETEESKALALSQAEKSADTKVTGAAPEKITERPEWLAITKIADKAGKEEGKQARAVLRDLYKREYDLAQVVEKSKPAVTVVQEMFRSVGESEVGFNNMRRLITSFDVDPAAAVPMLETLISDARKRAGLVLQSAELVTEAQQLDQQVAAGTLDRPAADKRKAELLELQKSRTGSERQQQQTQAERQRQQRAQAEQVQQRAGQEIQTAADTWEKEKLGQVTGIKGDPDYPALKSLHTSRTFMLAEARVQELGRMLTGKEARAVADQALQEVKAEVGRLLPRKPARTVINGGGNGSSGTTRQQPGNEFEEFKADVEAAKKRFG